MKGAHVAKDKCVLFIDAGVRAEIFIYRSSVILGNVFRKYKVVVFAIKTFSDSLVTLKVV